MRRREFLQWSAGGLFGLWAASRARAGGAAPTAPPARAKACIVLWMNGGPSQLDTWDPKPGTANGGPFKSLKTRVPGVEIGEHLPHLAEVADKLCIVRGMTSKEGNHDRASHLLHTGYPPNPTVGYPAFGGWVADELGDPKAELPQFISIDGPSASAGFLGVQNNPFVILNPAEPPQNTAYPRDVNMVRLMKRRAALDLQEAEYAKATADAKVGQRRSVYDKALRMMYAPRLKAFDIGEEAEAVQAAYGDSDFGRGCLMARRLVESGVKFVEVVLDGWDTHQNNFERTQKLMGALDPAMASLVRELDERKLLDSTLVLWAGEFGRTPKINDRDGRDHFPAAWSAVLAGGGVRGGVAFGATDGDGMKVVDKPVTVPNLFATLATQLGIDPDHTKQSPIGRPISITDNGVAVKEILL